MAHRIAAIDLGAYSVKVAIANPGFRHASLIEWVERPVPPPTAGADEPHEQRAGRVLGEIIRQHKLQQDTAFVAVSGDQVFVHILEFAFKTLRRQDLEKAVGAELESVLPVELDEMVYTFEVLPPDARVATAAPIAGALGDGPRPASQHGEDAVTAVRGGTATGAGAVVRGRVAPPAAGMRVLTYTMRRDRAQALISLVSGQGLDPRSLVPVGSPYARLLDRAPSLAALRTSGPVAVIDLGHERTDVVVVRAGKPIYSRTIARGGRQLTDAVARHWKLPFADAEKAKHSDGFIGSNASPPSNEAWQQVHNVMAAELAPLSRDLRQTLSTCRAKTSAQVAGVVLVGGTSRLRGLPAYLSEQLGVPVALLGADDATTLVGAGLAGAVPLDTAALALGVTADAETGKPMLDLRQGELAYKVDLSFIRAKATQLATAGLIIVGLGVVAGFAAHHKLRKAETILTERLAVESAELFPNEGVLTPEQISSRAVSGVAEASPLPKMSAYDVLLEINEKLPTKEQITLDITKLEIKDTKVTIEGTTKTIAEVDKVEEALKGIKCFGEGVSRGATNATAEAATFTFSIKSTCML